MAICTEIVMRLLLAPALIVGVLTAGLAVPAEAQTVPQRRSHSVQCLLAMSAANGSATNQTARDAARIGMLFFAAQLFGMDPDINLTDAAKAELPSLDRNKLQALIPQCGSEMQARERQIAQMGPGLQGRKPSPNRNHPTPKRNQGR